MAGNNNADATSRYHDWNMFLNACGMQKHASFNTGTPGLSASVKDSCGRYHQKGREGVLDLCLVECRKDEGGFARCPPGRGYSGELMQEECSATTVGIGR